MTIPLLDTIALPTWAADPAGAEARFGYNTTEKKVKYHDGTGWSAVGSGSGGTNIETTPIGAILPFGGLAAPSGWLICDGSPVSRNIYSSLFTAIGTSYGPGDGATTFNLPDMRGRSAVGAGAGSGGSASGTGKPTGGNALSARSVGSWGGEEQHALTVAEMPSHSHTITLPNINSQAVNAGGSTWGSLSGATTTGTTSSVGGGASHNTMQPYVVTNFIIKAVAQPAGQAFALAAGAVPAARVSRSAVFSVPNAAWTAVPFTVEAYDTDNLHDNTTNPTRLVCRTPGIYHIDAAGYWASAAGGTYRVLGLQKNGDTLIADGGGIVEGGLAAVGHRGNISTTIKLDVGEYVELLVYQDSGNPLPFGFTQDASPVMTMTWVGEGRGVVGEQTVPASRIRPTGAQTIANAAVTAVTFGATRWDTDNMWAAASPTRLTIRTPGLYDIGAITYFSINANGDRVVGIRVNGGNTTWAASAKASDIGRAHVSTHLNLNAGDYVEMVVWQNSGGSLDLVNASAGGNTDWSTEMWATLLGPPAKAVIPHARLSKAVSQSIANVGADTLVTFPAAVSDNDGMFAIGTPTRLTIKTPGVYRIDGSACWEGNNTGRRSVRLRVNGNVVMADERQSVSSLDFTQQSLGLTMELSVGDYVDMVVSQSSAAALNLRESNVYGATMLSVTKIGLSGQAGVSSGSQWAQSGTDIQPTNSGQVKVPNGIKFNDNSVQSSAPGLVVVARMGNGTNQVIQNAPEVVVPYDTEEYDLRGEFNPANYRFTPTRPGWYRISAGVYVAPAGTVNGNVSLLLFKNGARYRALWSGHMLGNVDWFMPRGSASVFLNGTTDYVQVFVRGQTGGNITGSDPAYSPLEIEYLNA